MSTDPVEKVPMTVLGKAQLEAELKRLIHEERPMVIQSIDDARSHGDISENAEYDAAKDRQAHIEGRIADIQNKLVVAEVIQPADIQSDQVLFGATVTLVDTEDERGSDIIYQIVGVDEADVKLGKVSIMSPLARALIGKKRGDIALVLGPKTEKEYEIKKIEYK